MQRNISEDHISRTNELPENRDIPEDHISRINELSGNIEDIFLKILDIEYEGNLTIKVIEDNLKQINKNFHQLALKCHPDKNHERSDAADSAFKKLTGAMDRVKKVLENPSLLGQGNYVRSTNEMAEELKKCRIETCAELWKDTLNTSNPAELVALFELLHSYGFTEEEKEAARKIALILTIWGMEEHDPELPGSLIQAINCNYTDEAKRILTNDKRLFIQPLVFSPGFLKTKHDPYNLGSSNTYEMRYEKQLNKGLALHYAFAENNLDLVEFISQNITKAKFIELLEMQDANGKKPLQYASPPTIKKFLNTQKNSRSPSETQPLLQSSSEVPHLSLQSASDVPLSQPHIGQHDLALQLSSKDGQIQLTTTSSFAMETWSFTPEEIKEALALPLSLIDLSESISKCYSDVAYAVSNAYLANENEEMLVKKAINTLRKTLNHQSHIKNLLAINENWDRNNILLYKVFETRNDDWDNKLGLIEEWLVNFKVRKRQIIALLVEAVAKNSDKDLVKHNVLPILIKFNIPVDLTVSNGDVITRPVDALLDKVKTSLDTKIDFDGQYKTPFEYAVSLGKRSDWVKKFIDLEIEKIVAPVIAPEIILQKNNIEVEKELLGTMLTKLKEQIEANNTERENRSTFLKNSALTQTRSKIAEKLVKQLEEVLKLDNSHTIKKQAQQLLEQAKKANDMASQGLGRLVDGNGSLHKILETGLKDIKTPLFRYAVAKKESTHVKAFIEDAITRISLPESTQTSTQATVDKDLFDKLKIEILNYYKYKNQTSFFKDIIGIDNVALTTQRVAIAQQLSINLLKFPTDSQPQKAQVLHLLKQAKVADTMANLGLGELIDSDGTLHKILNNYIKEIERAANPNLQNVDNSKRPGRIDN